MAEAARPTSARVLPLWLLVLLGVAATAAALWGLRTWAALVAPVFLAFVLTVVAHPMIGALRRRRCPTWLAVTAAVIAVDGGLVLFAIAVALSVGQLATVLPDYSEQWQSVLDNVRGTLSAAGVGQAEIDQALQQLQPSTVIGALLDLLSGLLDASVTLVIVLATALFMAAEGAGLPNRLAAVPGASRLQAALAEFAVGTRRYIVVTTIFGFLVAAADAVALYVMGIPLPLLWGLLSFLTNYIPNIGFILGLAPPTLLALLVGGPDLAVLVVVIYAVINFVLQSIVQPIFVGDAVGLSVTLTFLSVILWTAVLGPLGAVLAIPLTLFAHAILVGQDPARSWAKTLLAGTSAPAPRPQRSPVRAADHRRPPARRRGVPAGARRTAVPPRPRPAPTPAELVEAAPRR